MKSFKEFLTEAITLGGSGNKASLEAFMKDFNEKTVPNPFLTRMRIFDESVGIELTPWQGYIHISSIMSFKQKNSGEASKALKWITDLADKYGVKMDLTVSPIKGAGAKEGKNLNKAQLRAWYKRYGFIVAGIDNMTREPKK